MAIFLLSISIQVIGMFLTFILMSLYAYFKPEKFGRYYREQALSREATIFVVLFFWPITLVVWLFSGLLYGTVSLERKISTLFERTMQKGEKRKKWNKDVYTVDPNTIEKEDNTISY